MTSDAAYTDSPGLAPARYLQRAGQWDAALGLLPDGPGGAALRAEVLTDRHAWRLDPPEDALAAAGAITHDQPGLALLLTAQLEYWRQLTGRGGPPIAAGAFGTDVAAAFSSLTGHGELGGWAEFWHAVSLDNLARDTAGAAAGYRRALKAAGDAGDLLLESYVARHQGDHAMEAGDTGRGLKLLRRSLNIRAMLGARPHTAAAQALLAAALGEGDEARELRLLAHQTARELRLTWLLESIEDAGPGTARDA